MFKKLLWVLVIVLLIAQFFGPEKNQGAVNAVNPFLAETKPSKDVEIILKETCFDCHSNYTRYPWYTAITPLNYWMAHHVDDGKKHLNFSNWVDAPVKRKDHKMEELIEMVEDKEMPLQSYTWAHGDANLTDSQIKAVVEWAKQVRSSYNL